MLLKNKSSQKSKRKNVQYNYIKWCFLLLLIGIGVYIIYIKLDIQLGHNIQLGGTVRKSVNKNVTKDFNNLINSYKQITMTINDTLNS